MSYSNQVSVYFPLPGIMPPKLRKSFPSPDSSKERAE